MSQTILVAEDEAEVRSYFDLALRCRGYSVQLANDGVETLARLAERDVGLVLMDLLMPRKDGLETLREIRRMQPELPVIMVSGASSPSVVIEAMKNGATDFLAKPVTHEDLFRAVEKAIHNGSGPTLVAAGPAEHGRELGLAEHGNPQMKIVAAALKQIAMSDVPVVIQGESGVGKEVLAREIHAASPRAGSAFLKLNCAAVPAELLESELFGYERGAYTGAFKSTPGKFEVADGGTMLLDEIGDMDLKLQAKLLHVLQDKEFQRLGGRETVHVDVRVLAATHCDLEKAIEEGRFRQDLYYRLNVVNITIPPLRERKDEILPLAELFLRKYATPTQPIPESTPELKEALLAYHWPGNIRELENVMRKLLVLSSPAAIAQELRAKTQRKVASSSMPWPANGAGLTTDQAEPVSVLERVTREKSEAEAQAILAALSAARWNRKKAAAMLNIEYKGLLYKMKKLGIAGGRKDASPAALAAAAAGSSGKAAPSS
jgi:DNA-binding NtrC family response regulator